MFDILWTLAILAAVVGLVIYARHDGYEHGVVDATYNPGHPWIKKILKDWEEKI